MAFALAAIWRGFEVRAVLLAAALLIGATVGQTGAVFRRASEALTDPKWVLPICGAMAFASVVRETGCVDELVALLLRPFERIARSVLPGSGAVAFVVNTAIPSQTSTLAAVGPLAVALLGSLRTPSIRAGSMLVLGSSIAGELLNPGVAQVTAVAAAGEKTATELVVWLLPAAAAAFSIALSTFVAAEVLRPVRSRDLVRLPELTAIKRTMPSWRAVLPLLPVAFLLASHPALPWHSLVAKLTPAGFEIFAVMLAGATLTILIATPDRAAATKAWLEGLGFGFAQIVTLIAASAAVAKALEVSGVLAAVVGIASGRPNGSLALAFLLAFGLAVISGSGVGPSVALVTALEPRAAELGVHPLALGGALLFGAEAGRTTSPVAAVVLFGGSLTSVRPRLLAARLALPCLLGGAAGAVVCILHAR